MAPGRSASPGVPWEEREVGAGEGPQLLSRGVAGPEGVPDPDPTLHTEALGVEGVGGTGSSTPLE